MGTCEFEYYTGNKGRTTEVGLGGSVVTRLRRDLVGKANHIFNYFNFLFICYLVSTYYCQIFIVLERLGLTDATSLLN